MIDWWAAWKDTIGRLTICHLVPSLHVVYTKCVFLNLKCVNYFAGGVQWRPGWRTCPCFTSRNQLAPCKTRPFSNNSCFNNSNSNSSSRSVDHRPSAGWRTTVAAVRVVPSCKSSRCTSRTTRNALSALRSRLEPRCADCSDVPTSSARSLPNFAREFYLHHSTTNRYVLTFESALALALAQVCLS